MGMFHAECIKAAGYTMSYLKRALALRLVMPRHMAKLLSHSNSIQWKVS